MTGKPVILNLEPLNYDPAARALLEEVAIVADGPLCRPELLAQIENYNGLIVRLGHQIDAEVMGRAKNLRVIATATTGLNHIDMDEAAKRDIKIISLRGEREFLDGIHATAEHAFGLLLALIRKISAAHVHVLNGGWDRDAFRGGELAGKTIGIVGFGRLGSKVAHYAHAFGMRVVAYDPAPVNYPSYVEVLPLMDLLAVVDVLSIHVLYTPQTHHLLDRAKLDHLKPGAVVVNTARGGVIDEAALLDGLRSGRIAGAALDVLAAENNGDPDWMLRDLLILFARENPQLLLTPHIGGATVESMAKTERFMAKKLGGYFVSQL